MNIIERVGLGDGEGCVSFNKSVTAGALLTFAFAVWWSLTRLSQVPPVSVWSFGVIVIGAGFGLKGYMAGVARRTDTSETTTSTVITGDMAKVIEAIKTPAPERNAELGVQPSGRVPQVFDE